MLQDNYPCMWQEGPPLKYLPSGLYLKIKRVFPGACVYSGIGDNTSKCCPVNWNYSYLVYGTLGGVLLTGVSARTMWIRESARGVLIPLQHCLEVCGVFSTLETCTKFIYNKLLS